MASLTGPSKKICIFCKEDCSNRPRLQDDKGRYACKACYEQWRTRKKPAKKSDQAILQAELSASVRSDGGAAESVAIPLAVEENPVKTKTCPVCLTRMLAQHVVCGTCGYDERKGVQSSAHMKVGSKKVLKCSGCGYDLTGLRAMRCPECGKTFTTKSDWVKQQRRESRETDRNAYLRPLLMLLIGAGIVCAALGISEGWAGVGWYLFTYVLYVPTGIFGLWVCTWIFLDFGAPMFLTALRLAGIYAVVDVVDVVLGGIVGIPFIGWVALLLYIGLLSQILDMDVADAIAVGLITFLIRFAAFILLFSVMLAA